MEWNDTGVRQSGLPLSADLQKFWFAYFLIKVTTSSPVVELDSNHRKKENFGSIPDFFIQSEVVELYCLKENPGDWSCH